MSYPTINSALAALKLGTTARAFTALGLNATLGAAVAGSNPSAAVTLFAPSEAAWAKFLSNNTLGLTTKTLLNNTRILDELMRYHMVSYLAPLRARAGQGRKGSFSSVCLMH